MSDFKSIFESIKCFSYPSRVLTCIFIQSISGSHCGNALYLHGLYHQQYFEVGWQYLYQRNIFPEAINRRFI